MDPSSVPVTPSLLSQSLYRAGGSRSVRIGDPAGKGDPDVERGDRGGIKMREVRPGRKLETKNEFRGLLNANQVG